MAIDAEEFRVVAVEIMLIEYLPSLSFDWKVMGVEAIQMASYLDRTY
jgi:hypothetical protein